MMYVASVKNKETKVISIIKADDYKNKNEFAKDLRANGYSVRFISTEENFDSDCEKYHEKQEMNKIYRETKNETDKRIADSLNMTVAEYRRLIKEY